MADVLIVDDCADIRDLLAAILDAAGHRVREAQDGREALNLATQRAPDLALLDVTLPVLTGPDIAYELLVRNNGLERIPIVLISGVVGLSEMATLLGTPYFLRKPFSVDALLRLVDRALAERVPPQPRMETR